MVDGVILGNVSRSILLVSIDYSLNSSVVHWKMYHCMVWIDNHDDQGMITFHLDIPFVFEHDFAQNQIKMSFSL